MMARAHRPSWSISLVNVLFYAILFNSLCSASLVFKSFGLAVNKNNRRERKQKKTDVRKFIIDDDYGRHYKDVYAAIGRSRQVVTFRRENSTVVAFTSHDQNSSCLEESIGCKPFHSLGPASNHGGYKHYVLLAGVAGDCRCAVRHLKQIALNHSFEFGCDATGAHLANRLGTFLLNSRSERSLAVHAFIVSKNASSGRGSSRTGLIHEVGATGNVIVVRGGTIGGPHTDKAKQRLEERYRNNLNEEESRALVSELFDPMLNSLDAERDSGEELHDAANDRFEYIEVEDM